MRLIDKISLFLCQHLGHKPIYFSRMGAISLRFFGVYFLCFLVLIGCEQFESLDDDTVVTVMLYMCGSDLESELGSATRDLEEILDARLSDQVNVVIETGGALKWQNDMVSADTNQRFLVQDGELVLLDQALGLKDMADPNTLSDFISYSAKRFPADRYALILWDHGGGALDGFAVDENFDRIPMKIYELSKALDDGGVFFDFIGFDACLMSTIEVGLVLDDYADYMIASEETEPAGGWYYTDWLTKLSRDPSIDTLSLAKKIVDDYVNRSGVESNGMAAMLAVSDLSKIESVYKAFCLLLDEASFELMNQNFELISKGRSESKSFGNTNIDHVDLADLAKEINLEQSDVLVDTINDCVKYKASSNASDDVGGLSVYFPYSELRYFDEMMDVYQELDMDEGYTSFMELFVRIMLDGGYVDYEWEVFDKGEYYALILSDEDWALVSEIECQVYYDDGEGYLELGSDNLYEFDEDGDLMISFDHTWVAINGQIVPFYALGEESSEDNWMSYGYVPAFVNGHEVDLILIWDDENPMGVVAGYRYGYEESAILLRGLVPIKEGDVLEFVVDFYSYDGDYEDSYYLDEALVVDEAGLFVSYEEIGEGDCLVYYSITDLYQNNYLTEGIIFEYE